jgi:predicted metal-dependent enzyme (double-stranded beta helix superfamily)
MTDLGRMIAVPPALKRFIWDMQSMIELTESEREILLIGSDLMSRLVVETDWLPDAFARPDNTRPQCFQLYSDGLERFTITATVLSNGQTPAPILDPTWEILGVVHGTIRLERFQRNEEGHVLPKGEPTLMKQGQSATFGSKSRDALCIANGADTDTAVVIHVYGAEMTKSLRQTFRPNGDSLEALIVFDNGPDAPPYDIFSIQTRIED